jgi:hypothetical protein
MFLCRKAPIAHRQNKRVFQEVRSMIEFFGRKVSQKGGGRPYIMSAKLKPPVKFFIDDFHYHLDKKPLLVRVSRYRLVPCVFELLRFTKQWPEKGTGENYYAFTGQTPDGTCFKVVVRRENPNYVLQTIYPFK